MHLLVSIDTEPISVFNWKQFLFFFFLMHSRMESNLNMKDVWQTLKYVTYFSFPLVFSLILHCLCSSLICISILGLNPSNCHQNMSWTKRLTNAEADMVQNCSNELSVAHISPVKPFGKPPWKHCFHLPHQNHFSLPNANHTLCLARATSHHCWRCKPLTYKALITLARPSRQTHLHKNTN